jgi:hypothetical protein
VAKKIFLAALAIFAVASVGAIILLGYGMAETASHPTNSDIIPHSLRELEVLLWAIAGTGFVILLACAPCLPSDWTK